jgi:hypothetical protein
MPRNTLTEAKSLRELCEVVVAWKHCPAIADKAVEEVRASTPERLNDIILDACVEAVCEFIRARELREAER